MFQDASLEGPTESPKSVFLIIGTAEYNMVSLNSTLKSFLWEMPNQFSFVTFKAAPQFLMGFTLTGSVV